MRIALVLCCVLLAGCSTPATHIPLKEDIKTKIKSSDVVFVHTQTQLQETYEPSKASKYLLGGLIPGLIDAHVNGERAEEAQKIATPIHTVMANVDMDSKSQQTIISVIERSSWLGNCRRDYLSKYDKDMFKQKVDKTDRDVVLFVNCGYVLTPKFDALQGAVVLEMFPSSKFSAIKDGSSDVLIYRTLVVSKQPLPGASDNIETNVKLWSQNNGLLIKRALDAVIVDLASKLTAELSTPTQEKPDV